MRSDFVPLEQEDVPTPAANTSWEVLAAGGESVNTVPLAYAFFRFRAFEVTHSVLRMTSRICREAQVIALSLSSVSSDSMV